MTDNSNLEAKLDLRRRFLAELDEPIRVLETHAGTGVIRGMVYSDAEHWRGCDLRDDLADPIHIDSLLYLRHADLNEFNVIDIDPYGKPWHHLWLVSQRWSGPGVIFLTDGGFRGPAQMLGRAGKWYSTQVYEVLKVPPDTPLRFFGHRKEWIVRQLLKSWFPNLLRVSAITGDGVDGGCDYYAAVIDTGSDKSPGN